jgi:hypothetical protein
MKKKSLTACAALLTLALSPTSHAQETAFAAARRAGLEELERIFASATPLNFAQIPSAQKSGMCKSLFEGGKLVVAPSAFISTKSPLGTRFGDYGHSSYPDVWDTGSEELYDKIQAQAEKIVQAYSAKIPEDHRLLAEAFPDGKRLSPTLTLNDMLIRQPELDPYFKSRYPLQHPSLSHGKAVAYPISIGIGGQVPSFAGRVEYRQTADGLVIAGFQPSVEVDLFGKARRLESKFKGVAPTMYCFWYEEI